MENAKINLKKIEHIEISRSYDRKIKFGEQFEMLGLFSSYKAVLKPDSSEKEIAEVSEQLYEKCRDDVEYKVTELQNPQKALRGFAAIGALRTQMTKLEKENQKLKEQVAKLIGEPF